MKIPLLLLAFMAALLLSFAGSHSVSAVVLTPTTLSYSVSGGGQVQPPMVQYVHNGHTVTTQLTTTPTTYNTDPGTSYNVTSVLLPSNSTEKWVLAGPDSGGVGGTRVLTYYRQLFVTFDDNFVGNGFIFYADPVKYFSLGLNQTAPLQSSVWADYGSTYVFGNGTTHVPPNTRWIVADQNGTIEHAGTIRSLYSEQFFLSFTLSSVGPDPIQATILTESYGGTPTNRTLTAAGGSFWVDYNSPMVFQNAVYVPSNSYRWLLQSVSESVASAPMQVAVGYLEQYPITIQYAVTGGSEPSPPILTTTFGGQQMLTQLTASASLIWADEGSSYAVTGVLGGSTPTERWITQSATGGSASGPSSLDLEYFHQILVTFRYSVVGGGAIGPFNASFVSFGAPGAVPVGTTPVSEWVDFGTVTSVPGTFVGGSPLERWQLGSAPSTTMTSPGPLSLVYYHQFEIPMLYNVVGGGSPAPPALQGVQFGAPGTTQFQTGGSVWLDAGSPWTVSSAIEGSTGERWAAVGAVTGTVGPGTLLAESYQHEYYVTVSANAPAAGTLSGEGWVQNGAQVSVSENANQGWVFMAWQGSGNGEYSGRNQNFTVIVSSPVEERAQYFVGLTLLVTGGGTVTFSAGSHAITVTNLLTVFVPPGTNITLSEKPDILKSFLGWNGISAGNSGTVVITDNRPLGVTAVFAYNSLEELGVLTICIGGIAYGVAYLVWKLRPANPFHRSVRPNE